MPAEIGVLEGVFFRQRFRPRVAQLTSDGWVLRPRRNQAPDEEIKLVRLIVRDRKDRLAGGDVVPGGHVCGPFGDPGEEVGEVCQVDQRVTPAHAKIICPPPDRISFDSPAGRLR